METSMRILWLSLAMFVAGTLKGPVTLAPAPAIAHGVAAFPRLAPGGGVTPEIAAKINASLKKLDATVAAAALDCRTSFRQQQHKPGTDVWSRTVDVTMRGPRYVSFLATDSYFCGGMYPNDGMLLPLVCDLTFGRPVDWIALMPKGASASLDTASDGTRVGVVTWPALSTMARNQADDDCKSAYSDEQSVKFVLWLDGKKGTIEAQAFSFPHAIAGCAEQISIPAPQARKLGFAAELVDALDAAKKL